MTIHGELMRLHVQALFTHDTNGDLDRVNEPNGVPAPRFFIGGTADGAVHRFRRDVTHELRGELEAAIQNDALRVHDPDSPASASRYEEILARAAPVQKTWAGPAFCFPDELPARDGAVVLVTEAEAGLLHPLLPAWVPDVRLSPPLFARVVDGRAVAVCGSVRITARAHEAGVETAEAFRGRGYAAQVVAVWARAVRALGAEPLYSTSWQNTASRAVARKLGLIHFGSDLHIT